MRRLRAWLFRLAGLFSKTRRDRELAEEMESHLQLHIEDNLRAGMFPAQARRQALIKLGGVEQTKEMYRERRGIPVLETLMQDLRHGLRVLRKSPGFTAVAVLTLALGISAATVIFSVIQCMVLDPFPYADGHRLMMLVVRDTAAPGEEDWAQVTEPEFRAYQEQSHAFEEVIGLRRIGGRVTGAGDPVYVYLEAVTTNAFRFLGVSPLMGRTIGSEDGRPGAPAVAVLSYEGWRTRFAGDPGIVGRTVILMDRPTTIIGVMPPHCSFDYWADLWIPVTSAQAEVASNGLMLIGRLKRGATAQQASAEADVLAKRFAAGHSKDRPTRQEFSVRSLADIVSRDFRGTLFVLFGAVGLILLIACANVGSLLLARTTARHREVAIRASVGATRLRIIRQLMVENLLLGIGGAVAGGALAWAGLQVLLAGLPVAFFGPMPDIRMNSAVVLFLAGLTQLSTLLFGLAPALFAVRRDLQAGLGSPGKGAGGGYGHGRLRGLLVAGQVALSLVLLAGAGLLVRSYVAMRRVEMGYRADGVLALGVKLPRSRYRSVEFRQQFFERALERVRALPGVISSAIGDPMPPLGTFPSAYELTGGVQPREERGGFVLCSDGYLETLGVHLLQGRPLTGQDVRGARRVALVNQTLANRHFGGASPVGRLVKVSALETWRPTPVKEPWFEIVGVIADVRHMGPDQPVSPVIYLPMTMSDFDGRGILARTAGEPARWSSAVRQAIHTLDQDATVEADRGDSLRSVLTRFSLAIPTFELVVLCLFAAVALTITSVGTFSLLAYAVRCRTHEIGIRLALGAQGADMRRMILSMGFRLLLVGIGAGTAGSIVLTRLLSNRLWGLAAVDPLTLAAAALLLTGVTLSACYIPARRAARVDPIRALQHE